MSEDNGNGVAVETPKEVEVLAYGRRKFKVPYLDMAPAADTEENRSLEASIKERGVISPVIVDTDDLVISGHRRLRIACKLGIPIKDVPIHVQTGKRTDEELVEDVVAVNFVGRACTPERRAHMAHRLRQEKGYSTRRIGKVLGVTHARVQDYLETPDPLGQFDGTKRATVTGTDGRTMPAKETERSKAKRHASAPERKHKGLTPKDFRGKKKEIIDMVSKLHRLLDRFDTDLGAKYHEQFELMVEDVRAKELPGKEVSEAAKDEVAA